MVFKEKEGKELLISLSREVSEIVNKEIEILDPHSPLFLNSEKGMAISSGYKIKSNPSKKIIVIVEHSYSNEAGLWEFTVQIKEGINVLSDKSQINRLSSSVTKALVESRGILHGLISSLEDPSVKKSFFKRIFGRK